MIKMKIKKGKLKFILVRDGELPRQSLARCVSSLCHQCTHSYLQIWLEGERGRGREGDRKREGKRRGREGEAEGERLRVRERSRAWRERREVRDEGLWGERKSRGEDDRSGRRKDNRREEYLVTKPHSCHPCGRRSALPLLALPSGPSIVFCQHHHHIGGESKKEGITCRLL